MFLSETFPQHAETFKCTITNTWIGFAGVLENEMTPCSAQRSNLYFNQRRQVDFQKFLRQCGLCRHGEAFGEKLLRALTNDWCFVAENSDCRFGQLLEIGLRKAKQINMDGIAARSGEDLLRDRQIRMFHAGLRPRCSSSRGIDPDKRR